MIVYAWRRQVKNNTKYVAPKGIVELFLEELIKILDSDQFRPKKDLVMIFKKTGEESDDSYITINTLLELNYDTSDVIDRLRELMAEEYLESLIDDKGEQLPPYFVFIKTINAREVYIKVKISSIEDRKILVMSFHFLRYPLNTSLPYA